MQFRQEEEEKQEEKDEKPEPFSNTAAEAAALAIQRLRYVDEDYEEDRATVLIKEASKHLPEALEKTNKIVDEEQLERLLFIWVKKQIAKHNYKEVVDRALDQTKLKAFVRILSRGSVYLYN